MINEIIIDLVSDYIEQEFDLLTSKHVLFKNNIINKAPAGIESALRNMKEAGERIRMPLFEIETTAWQNILGAPVLPNTVGATPATATTYTAVGLTMRDEYAIKVWRRKLYEWSLFNNARRVWGVNAEMEIAKQLAQDVVRSCFDLDCHMVLQAAIPAANEYNETTQDFLGRAAGARTIEPRVINQAKGQINDNMNMLTIMICHSKVWRDLVDAAYGTYSNATLLQTSNLSPETNNVWLANGMVVYVTDRCKNDVGETGEVTYETYLLAPGTLQLAIHEPYNLVVDNESALHESKYARGNIGYIPHLKGIEYLNTAPVRPTSAQLQAAGNWQLGRYAAADQVLAVRLITN